MRSLSLLLLLSVLCSAVALSGARYALEGEVVAVNDEARTLTLRHGGIAGELEAGETVFSASTGDRVVAREGATVKGVVFPYAGSWRIEKVFRLDPVAERNAEAVNSRLRRETVARGNARYLGEGDFMPAFALYDQRGDRVFSDQLKGTLTMMNFIFTRCGMPEMCPAASARMADLQERLREEGLLDQVTLVSVSFDPGYDTPGVLWGYAEARGIEEEHYHFLTGEKQVVADLLKQFGIGTRGEGAEMLHTMATLLFDENGKILYRKNGSTWETEDFYTRIAAYLKEEEAAE